MPEYNLSIPDISSKTFHMKTILSTFCLTITVLLGSMGVGYADKLWSALKSGNHFVLICHALAPGFSDPDYFNVKDCKTQRVSSHKGRYQ